MGLDKDQVNYRTTDVKKECINCDHYFVASGLCDVVSGNISPENVCDRWEMKSMEPNYKDKEFFQKHYDRSTT